MKRLVLRLAALTALFISNLDAQDCIPIGIVGGQSSSPYAALLHHNGELVTISGLPSTGVTYRVGINSRGESLIGGTEGSDAYAAFVDPNGTLIPISGLIAPGEIYFVDINDSGLGIVGGGHFNTNVPYAALVYQSGVASPFSLPLNGLVYGVAIDSFGDGIVGGIGPMNSAYAALTTNSGGITPLTGLPNSGAIFWVSVNDSKRRLIGGKDGASIYAAFVNPEGGLQPISQLPLGQLYSVGINESGSGILGGTSLNLPYAALVSRSGEVTELSGIPTTTGIIYNATLNRSGTGLIAGFSTTGPFGAFVAPNGNLTPLKNLPTGTGFLDGAALHPTGIALVGGESFNTPFAALAAPNGTLVYLDNLPATGAINSCGLRFLDHLVPKSIGPFDSWANTQFTFSNVLTQHLIQYKNDCKSACEQSYDCCDSASLWLSIFGNYVRSNCDHSIPSYWNRIAGAVLGFDYYGCQDFLFGAALAYAYNNVSYDCNFGHTTINQESAVLYATYSQPCFYVNASLWGGLFQIDHERCNYWFTSKSSPSGWNLNPHIEFSTPLCVNFFQEMVIEPYAMLDWANNWVDGHKEKGWHGFNIKLNEQHTSILRSEIGVRFYETFDFACGCLTMIEKVGYVNKNPTQTECAKARFIGANSTFDVQTVNGRVQDLAAVQAHMEWTPSNMQAFYGAFDYQGEFGCFSTSNMLTLTLGYNF